MRVLGFRAVERAPPVPAVLARVPLAADLDAEAELALDVPPAFVARDFAAPDLAAADRVELDREVLLLARGPVERDAPEPRPLELRDDPDRDDEELDEPDEPSSVPHLPVITRCAASATASAMMLPSLVALDIMLVAACEAVSAASRPASRILRRALGLALIAAAAAARPAASISLLIAALAILSIVSLPDEEPDDPELDERLPDDPVFGDFAIVTSSKWYGRKTHQSRNGSLMSAEARHFRTKCKGHRRGISDGALRHGQRLEVTAVRSALRLTNTPFRPLC